MAGQQRAELPIGEFSGRIGSRWINTRPSPEEIAEWFKENVPMHAGMDPARYVGGLTLIESNEYTREVVEQDGRRTMRKVKNLVNTPYCKVETRVQYFWDLMAAHPEWAGSIEPVDTRSPRADNLPPGFFRLQVQQDQKTYSFVACTVRVRVLEREHKNHREQGVICPPPATKMIPVLTQNYQNVEVDPFSLMKAETGATGRALGLAGMLVVPGAGVATAEDMLEAQQGGPTPEGETALPPPVEEAPGLEGEDTPPDPEASLRAEALEKLARLEAESPEKHAQFQDWAKGRNFKSLEDIGAAQLRGVVRKLDKDLA